MANTPKYLYMISQNYPYGNSEVYLERELKAFSNHYDKIFLFPLSKLGTEPPRSLPENVELCSLLMDREHVVDKVFFLKNILTVNRLLKTEMHHTDAKEYLKKNRKEFAAQIAMMLKMKSAFEQQYLTDKDVVANASFYSVWMDEGALLFSLLKKDGKIPSFSFRLHGYDLYDYRRPGNYMPFQGICFEQCKNIFIVSKAGYDYLKAKGKYAEKLKTNYSGIYDHGVNPQPEGGRLNVVSVSNLYGIKRVDQIPEILGKLTYPVKWTHFGDGGEREKVEQAIAKLPENVTAELKGAVNFKVILEHYQSDPTHVFMHLSETEGLPMAVVEAQSFGIPAIATNVGGTAEIVNDKTGILIDADFDHKAVLRAITQLQENMTSQAFRTEVKQHWKSKFDADTNYAKFIKMLD